MYLNIIAETEFQGIQTQRLFLCDSSRAQAYSCPFHTCFRGSIFHLPSFDKLSNPVNLPCVSEKRSFYVKIFHSKGMKNEERKKQKKGTVHKVCVCVRKDYLGVKRYSGNRKSIILSRRTCKTGSWKLGPEKRIKFSARRKDAVVLRDSWRTHLC